MVLELSIYGLSSLLLGFIGLFAALVLALSDHEKAGRPLWLSGFLIALSWPMLMGFFEEAGWLGEPALFYPPVIAAFGAGPALYLYARLPWQQTLVRRDFIHVLPLFVGLLTAINWGQAQTGGDPGYASVIWAALLYVNSIFYAAITLHLLKRYRRALRDHYSDAYRHRLNWLRVASWGLLAVIATDVVFGMLLSTRTATIETARLTLSLLLSLMIFILSFSALRHPARYLVELAEAPRGSKAAYANSAVTTDALEKWRSQLQRVMVEQRPYLTNDLSLSDLAELLDVRPHNLSQLLNQSLGVTFYDYINQARIRHACELLSNSRRTILEIAFASGFNNKASFYSSFRQQMNTTPSAYRLAAGDSRQPSTAA